MFNLLNIRLCVIVVVLFIAALPAGCAMKFKASDCEFESGVAGRTYVFDGFELYAAKDSK